MKRIYYLLASLLRAEGGQRRVIGTNDDDVRGNWGTGDWLCECVRYLRRCWVMYVLLCCARLPKERSLALAPGRIVEAFFSSLRHSLHLHFTSLLESPKNRATDTSGAL